jgi:hypothetical protein
MERILHHVWKYKLYSPETLVTTTNAPVSVIDTGIHNTNAGPDFHNARVKIGDLIWSGNVEIHEKSSDWFKHKHDLNKAYDTVILHIVGQQDAAVYRSNGEPVPQAVLKIPDHVRRNIDWLLFRDISRPCLPAIKAIDPIIITSWKDVLSSERMEQKATRILQLLDRYNDDWNEVFYITLTRNFGFGLNNEAFEQLACHLPYINILKQRSSHSQIEALIFGQAGLLEEQNNCHYYRLLRSEYQFLARKYNLKSQDSSLIKSMRTRPVNFPHVRLAQLAAIWVKYDTLFSRILEEDSLDNIRKLFQVPASSYWDTRYNFNSRQLQATPKIIGESGLNIILINTVAPLLFAYGQKRRQYERCDQALNILESLPPEKNMIVNTFSSAGIPVNHAGDSQALIQLQKSYCEKKQCLHCRIGHKILKRIHI